jgi:spore germination cell wall hydrolase CwlJ-like protein
VVVRLPNIASPRRIAAIVLILTAVIAAALSAHVAVKAIVADRTIVVPAGSTAPARAPVAAEIAVASSENAAPAKGVTGTTALPVIPISAAQAAAIVSANVGVVPAAPFTLRGIANTDRTRALECLTAAIYYEAASEPDAGQAAVAQVVLNRVRHPAFPASVCGVVYQGSEHAGCQFSFACDGAGARIPLRGGWARAARAAALALTGRVFAPVGLATHYHTYAVTPAWNRSLVMTNAVGAHFFHRWKGYWGTAAAFRQIYAGGEPVPGPHVAAVVPVAVAALPIAAPVTAIATVLPAHAGSGSYLVATPAAREGDHLPPASQVLDKWKDSGTPLK